MPRFQQFPLQSFLLGVSVMAVCLVVHASRRQLPTPVTAHEAMLMELESAAAAEYAIVFVQLDWAFLQQERQFFGEFANIYNSKGLVPEAHFHLINFTSVSDGYAPLAALPGWDEHDPGPNSHQINGQGEIIWLKNGSIVGIGRQDHIASPEEAVRMTQTYFGTQET